MDKKKGSGGSAKSPCLSTEGGGGGLYVKCPRLSTRGGGGVKIGSNLVHVVVEWPLMRSYLCISDIMYIIQFTEFVRR